ncbi:MAG: hypothetical protein JNK05_05000, partial [Myxococcales bacterium]|nr:hypothetical protein [Myxococcales bacterium]
MSKRTTNTAATLRALATLCLLCASSCVVELHRVERSRRSVPLAIDAGTDSALQDARRDTGVDSTAGNECTDDAMCGTLSCDTSIAGGLCTSTTCTQNANQANEALQCGGTGATCLTIGDGADANARCVKSCRPTMSPNCRPGHVCTGWWSSHLGGTPDSPGCFPFCSDDSHCVAPERCNTRTGTCQTMAPDPSRISDGQPCRLPTASQP